MKCTCSVFSQRKNAENLKQSLEEIVVAVFCTSLVGAGDIQKAKLNKVISKVVRSPDSSAG